MTTEPDDETLVRRIRFGDDTAFADLYLRYRERLLRASRVAGADAEDVVQETFLRLWQALHRLESDVRVYPYAYVVARRLAVERLAEQALFAPIADADDEVSDPAAAVSLDDALRAALAALPSAQRDAVGYRVLDALPRAVAARLMGVALGEVDVLVARGLVALRARVTPP